MDPAELALRFRAKDELRRRLRAIRRAVPAEARLARAAKIAEAVAARPEWARASVVALYRAMHSEADLSRLEADARRAGKRVVLPRIAADGESLSFAEAPEGAALEESGYGFDAPPADALSVPHAAVEVVIVPALAVDERGHRLGYGRGFYDRALREMTGACRMAVGFDFQLLSELPDTPGDEPVDLVITDARVIEVARTATRDAAARGGRV